MVSTFSSGSSMQWNPNPNQMEFNPSSTDAQFTFLDFLPICREKGALFSIPKFDNFRALVDRANDWLRAKPGWKVVTCESVEFKREGKSQMETEKMVYMEYGDMAISYVRGLRIWIEKSRIGEENVQQIGYLNIVPQVRKQGGIFTSPSYENLNETVSRFNTMNQTHPIPGRIITVESQEMKTSNPQSIDPDESTWTQHGDLAKHFVFVIRVFYEMSSGVTEQLGIADFIPDVITTGGVFTLPQYEPFSNVVTKASNWIASQAGIRVCNAQSLEIKVNRGNDINSQRMSYIEHGSIGTCYVRVLRVAFTIQSHLNISTIRELSCKTFVPVPLQTGLLAHKYESLMQTKHRVSEWIKATGVQVISAETSALRLYAVRGNIETSFSYHRPEQSEYWIFVIRIYIYGSYQEPPPEMLPPIPIPEEQNCCTIT